MGLKQRHDTTANWAAANPVMEMAERGYDQTLGKWKTGDGVTAWLSLSFDSSTGAYVPGGTDVAITDGGTGVSTLPTGLLKGAGTGAITAATAGTDYYNPGGTDVAVADGGTGASSAAAALTNLGAAPTASPTFTGTVTLPTGLTGIVKTASGVVSTATAGTDFLDATSYNGIRPSVHGMLGWAFDPAMASAVVAPTAGQLNLIQIRLVKSITVTSIWLHTNNAGTALTNVGVGIWTAAGALVQASINANGATTTAFATPGPQHVTVTSLTMNDGDYVGFWVSGTTAPQFTRAASAAASIANINLAAPNLRFATTNNTGLTTTAPPTFGTQTGSASQIWAAVS